ncbi:MAG TPA: hypothetical protein VE999_10615 [Gemmataceae bacterium]|nr:hypothetical protein [Gemmataceae bacterium]
MKYLTGLFVMVFFCATASAKEPMLEWTLKYVKREVPRDSKESLREASDYRKHKKDFKQKISVTNYTCGFAAAAARASLDSMSLRLVLIPMPAGKIRILGDCGPDGDKGLFICTIDTAKDIKYGEEMIVGRSGSQSRDPCGQVTRFEVNAFVLVVKQVDGDFSKLIRSKHLEILEKEP